MAANGMRPLWVTTAVVLGAQCVGLVVYSAYLYHRGDLTSDFAHNVQAWYLIGHGDVNPIDTVRATANPFWQDHFDVVIWPLSLLRLVWPSPYVLLVLQDVAIALTELVAMRWIGAVLVAEGGRRRVWIGVGALVLLVANPWWYETASFDVHLGPLALPFVTLAAYSLWAGRWRRAVVAGAACLLFGATVAELLALVALAALASRRVRRLGGVRPALLLVAAAAGLVVLATALNANQASNVSIEYGYLAGKGIHASSFSVLGGAARHPGRVLHALASRWNAVGQLFATTGVVGLCTPWGLLVSLGTVVPAALAKDPTYISDSAAFQTLAVVPFVTVGSVMTVLRVWRRIEARASAGADACRSVAVAPERDLGGALTLVVVSILAVGAVLQDGRVIHTIPGAWWKVDATTAATLRTSDHLIPDDAEVIASNGVMGRYAERKAIYPLIVCRQPFQIKAKEVMFVFAPLVGNESLPNDQAVADIDYVEHGLGGKVLVREHGVTIVEWRPPSSLTGFFLPPHCPQ